MGAPSSRLDQRVGDGVGERCDVVLQPSELLDHVLGDEVGPGRGDLPELHERGSEPLERVAEPDAEGLRARPARGAAGG